MDALISASQLDSLLERTSPYSQRELFQLASFSFPSLADKLSDLSCSEKSTVQRLEGVNLFHYLNACMNACRVAIGADTTGLEALMSSYKYASMISEIISVAKEESNSKVKETEIFCVLFVKMILSKGDPHFNVKLDGQVPTKLFSFRQTGADNWFSTITGYYTRIVAHVLESNGLDDAEAVLFMQCAFHMHHSQPGKYSITELDREKIFNVAEQFVSDFGR